MTAPENKNKMQQLIDLFCKSPSAALWVIVCTAASVIYTDCKAFINEQNETLKSINSTQVQMQVELRDLNTRMSVELRELNTRLSELESRLIK